MRRSRSKKSRIKRVSFKSRLTPAIAQWTFIGVLTTILIFSLSYLFSGSIYIGNEIVPKIAVSHGFMLILAFTAIFIFDKNIKFRIAPLKFHRVKKVFIKALIFTIVLSLLLSKLKQVLGGDPDIDPTTRDMNFLQQFIFLFLLASLAEELLFRGFLQNILSPMNRIRVIVSKRRISLPVIISAILYGLSYLVLIKTDANAYFILNKVLYGIIMGALAGYYQEKYQNFAYALLVHLTGSLPLLYNYLSMM